MEENLAMKICELIVKKKLGFLYNYFSKIFTTLGKNILYYLVYLWTFSLKNPGKLKKATI